MAGVDHAQRDRTRFGSNRPETRRLLSRPSGQRGRRSRRWASSRLAGGPPPNPADLSSQAQLPNPADLLSQGQLPKRAALPNPADLSSRGQLPSPSAPLDPRSLLEQSNRPTVARCEPGSTRRTPGSRVRRPQPRGKDWSLRRSSRESRESAPEPGHLGSQLVAAEPTAAGRNPGAGARPDQTTARRHRRTADLHPVRNLVESPRYRPKHRRVATGPRRQTAPGEARSRRSPPAPLALTGASAWLIHAVW